MGRAKVSIIGAGRVGSTTAQILAYKNICDVVLWNRTANLAEGVALDISESAPIEGFDCSVTGTGDWNDVKGSSIVVLTAGVPRREGMSRDELIDINASVVKNVCRQIKIHAPDAKLIVLTNPLDVMVYLAMKVTGFPKERVVGMAGILDSSRFAEFIAEALGVSGKKVDATVLGSHGDLMVPLARLVKVDGKPLEGLMPKKKVDGLIARTRDGGAEIIKLEAGSAYYAPASALVLMIESILLDKKMILPCAAYLSGEYGERDLFLGVPVVLGAKGVEKIVELDLDQGEKDALMAAATKIKEQLSHLKGFERLI